MGVKSSTQNSFIYFELGRTSLQCLRFYNIIKYWIKHVIVKTHAEVQPNKLTWAKQVRDLLARYGFYPVWLQHSVGNPKLFSQTVKQRIHYVDVEVLNDTMSTRALFYRTISQFEFSLYLDVIQVKK